jgi:hypothetical protein
MAEAGSLRPVLDEGVEPIAVEVYSPTDLAAAATGDAAHDRV